MIYLKEFETQAAYDAAKDGLLTPNVSLITENGEIKYLKETPTPTHEYVDLGLSSGTLWATMNIGASSITDNGLYYQWGDTQGHAYNDHEWDDATYKWFDVENNVYTKYNATDGKRILDNTDDAAIAAWGNGWHIPTKAQFEELIDGDNVTTAWTADYQGSGVSGYVLTDKTDSTKKLFFPAAGEANQGVNNLVGSFGKYWSKTRYTQCNFAWILETSYSSVFGRYTKVDSGNRAYGMSIRPVKDA